MSRTAKRIDISNKCKLFFKYAVRTDFSSSKMIVSAICLSK